MGLVTGIQAPGDPFGLLNGGGPSPNTRTFGDMGYGGPWWWWKENRDVNVFYDVWHPAGATVLFFQSFWWEMTVKYKDGKTVKPKTPQDVDHQPKPVPPKTPTKDAIQPINIQRMSPTHTVFADVPDWSQAAMRYWMSLKPKDRKKIKSLRVDVYFHLTVIAITTWPPQIAVDHQYWHYWFEWVATNGDVDTKQGAERSSKDDWEGYKK